MRDLLLSVEGLTKRFGGVVAIDDVTLDCREGERLAIIGPNGAGKTTLFSVMSGFVTPDAGTVRFAGERVDGRSASRVCQAGMARTFQVTRPFKGLSVRENVMAAAYLRHRVASDAQTKADAVLERFGLAALGERRAEDLNVLDRKRLELARAYATDPRLLLLDEVGAGLRPSDLDALSGLVRALNVEDGITVIFVEHLMALVADLAERVVVLHHGQVLKEGPVNDVMSDPAVVEAYLGEQDLIAEG